LRLAIRVNPVDLTRPVEVTYGDLTLRLTSTEAERIGKEIGNAVMASGKYASLVDNHDQRGEIVVVIGPIAIEMTGRLANRCATRLAMAAATANDLMHASGSFREFSHTVKDAQPAKRED
jgi:hypothetical protein